ncbi:nuclear pore complex protein Nup88 [Agrilus planipennis]|uniref:Nuclear pore complex protein Nup88 n=1 Tax=Agrilus planipennis TaxID=224129 RepID=A0A7F5R5U2_AGRPL|nr:nuclear pore complex protein Nup88 [Agrilus planipennis]
MSSTDYLNINDHKIFKNLRKTLPKSIDKVERLLTVNDDILYTWDFQDNCVLTLNIKAARSKEKDNVSHQTLLPNYPLLFTPEFLTTNSSNTLLAVAGPAGVLIMEIPARCPPYGAFAGNKEVVYCRSHSLEERLLCCGNNVEVHQVRFHPGSPGDNHVVVLTSDNFLRFYQIINATALILDKYQLGRSPTSVMPCSKVYMLTDLGETAIDFDFGPPELEKQNAIKFREVADKETQSFVSYKGWSRHSHKFKEEKKIFSTANDSVQEKNLKNVANKWGKLQWPIYLLYGNATVCTITIPLNEKSKPKVRGPLPIIPDGEITYKDDACALLCLKTTPSILCLATSNGNVYHLVVLPETQQPQCKSMDEYLHRHDRSLYVYEKIELELGLATCQPSSVYICPIFLYPDDSRSDRYFAIHETGIHSVTVPSANKLQKFFSGPEDDLENVVNERSSADYLLCTKIANSDNKNPVIGFALYYNPPSVLVLLSNGQLVVLSLAPSLIHNYGDIDYDNIDNLDSPLKKMLREPFDVYVQRILKQAKNQPILKLSGGNHTQQECYELLQRASQSFRENHFKHHQKAIEEIEKRVKTLNLLKNYQLKEVDRMQRERLMLQEKAGYLAEKYEDIKDKQEELTKRCHQLLLMVAEKKTELSEAEKKFLEELKQASKKTELYLSTIDRLKKQQKYQDVQMENWKNQNTHKETGLGSVQSSTIRSNLQDMSNQITNIIKEINEYKTVLGIK